MSSDRPWRITGTHPICYQRFRRFLPWLAFILFIIFIQFYATSVRDFPFLRNTIETLTHYKHRKSARNGPLHVLLVSYARTGSSFTGDMLQNLPNTFYSFEPLHFLGSSVLNSSFAEARELLYRVFNCNFSKIENFLMWLKHHEMFMKLQRNIRYWNTCKKLNSCYNEDFIENYCRNHSTVVVKTCRITLTESYKLFDAYPDLNLKIIYLTRDPRGTLNSRLKHPVDLWCKRDPACSNVRHFCSNLRKDLNAACSYLKDKPTDFMVLRYEDLAADALATATSIAKFLGYSSLPSEIEKFLRAHTSVTGNVMDKNRVLGLQKAYTTYRNSSATAFSWMKELKFEVLTEIQKECQDILRGLGYYLPSNFPSINSSSDSIVDLHTALRSTC